MTAILFLIIFIGTFILMECVAWLTHKYIMHGFLWNLHADHHQKTSGFFEKNDWFFVIFATPSILLIYNGIISDVVWQYAMGFGIMGYGFTYFMVHDVIIHQRFKWFTKSKHPYILGIRWAHKMHHKHLTKEHGESFGMLYVHRKYRQKIVRDRQYSASRHTSPQRSNTENTAI